MTRRSRLVSKPAKRNKRPLSKRIGRALQKGSFALFLIALLIVSTGAVSLGFVALYQYLLKAPYFMLTDLTVEGVAPDMRMQLIQMAGLDVEISTLELDLEDIRHRMEIHPWVRKVELARRLPNSLAVKVEMRTPVALICEEAVSYVDANGEVFKELEPGDETGYPLLSGLSNQPAVKHSQVTAALALLDTLKAQGAGLAPEKISEIHFRGGGLVSIYLVDMKAEIKADMNRLAGKLGDLVKVLEHLETSGRKEQASAIDLNYEDGVVVSFRRG